MQLRNCRLNIETEQIVLTIQPRNQKINIETYRTKFIMQLRNCRLNIETEPIADYST